MLKCVLFLTLEDDLRLTLCKSCTWHNIVNLISYFMCIISVMTITTSNRHLRGLANFTVLSLIMNTS